VTADAYDGIAEPYDADVADSFVHRVSVPALVEACRPGHRVLDLACGQGVLARALAQEGRRVVGVDTSTRLLEIASRHEGQSPLGIEYRRDDARTLATLEDECFDGVASNMAIGDVDDLGRVFRAVARVLRPGGWFAFAALHPCFCPPRRATVHVEGEAALQVGRYFEEGPHRRSEATPLFAGMEWHHRTLSTIWRELRAAGLVIEGLIEPQPPDDVAAKAPIYSQVAVILVVLAVKPA
jgi:2-polyprenyl-3-methyl-5-hydroxy-6-metoxy-1,4-benzoquinol methylase